MQRDKIPVAVAQLDNSAVNHNMATATAMTMEMTVLSNDYGNDSFVQRPIAEAEIAEPLPVDLSTYVTAEPVPETAPALPACVVESTAVSNDVPQSRLLLYAKSPLTQFIHLFGNLKSDVYTWHLQKSDKPGWRIT